jgi:hypothetical protein
MLRSVKMFLRSTPSIGIRFAAEPGARTSYRQVSHYEDIKIHEESTHRAVLDGLLSVDRNCLALEIDRRCLHASAKADAVPTESVTE